MSDVPPSQPGDHLRRNLQRLRAKRGDAAPSQYELDLEKGAAGELRFGEELNAAAARRGGCWVLHGLVLEGRRADIDHLVIGPAGVVAIDSKTWDGRVWIGRIGLGRGRRASRKEVDGMSRQINRVYSRLATAGYDDVPVEGVICLVNKNRGIPSIGLSETRGVKVGHPKPVAHHALRDGTTDAATVERVARVIQQAFDATGGSQPPTDRRSSPPPTRGQRARRTRRITRRLPVALLALAVAVIAAAAIISAVHRSVDSASRTYRAYSRDELMTNEAAYRRLAARRARGSVRGPKVRAGAEWLLVYRRGTHCRVTVHVSNAWPALGGGRVSRVRSAGCKRRR